MKIRKPILTSVFLLSFVVASLRVLQALAAAQGQGWTIPPGAATETNPLAATPDVLKKGESLYKTHCATCHGPKGLGDGPSVDRSDRKNTPANLVKSRNPEGLVFYKVWNGRDDPKMPAFKSRMTKDEAWATVAFVTTRLRAAPE